jgi:DNA-binding CsgD family transcriptional regulator
MPAVEFGGAAHLSDGGVAEDVIEAIYEAAAGPGDWSAAMAAMLGAVGADSGCFSVCETPGARVDMLPIGIVASAAAAYTAHFAGIDPFVPALLAAPRGRAHSTRALVPRAAMERSETYRDWAAPNGIQEACGIVVDQDAARTVVLAMMRGRRGDDFDGAALGRLESLAGHARRALRLQRRLGAGHDRAAALDRVGEAVLLCAADGRVLDANSAGAALLRDGDGLRLADDRLVARRPAETVALAALIAGDGGTLRIGRAAPPPLLVVVAPGPARYSPLSGASAAALVFVSDPARAGMPSATRLIDLFGLTPMQAALAREILRGDGVERAAERLGITRATARSHLALVFEKTRTSRQAELVRVLLSAAPDFEA